MKTKTKSARFGLMSGLLLLAAGTPVRTMGFRLLLGIFAGTAMVSTASAQDECELGITGQLGVAGCNLGGNHSTWTQGRVASHGDILYGGHNMQYCGGEMIVLDASDPANPIRVGTFKVPGGRNETDPDGQSNVFEILADPDRMVVYISTSSPWVTQANRIYAVDVSDPSNPTELGRLLCGFTGYGMTLRGDHLFLARGNGLDIINVSDPAQMTIVGSVAGGGSPRRMTDVAVSGNYAYMSGQTSTFYQGIEVFDISNLASPQKIYEISQITVGEGAGNSGRIPSYLQIAGDALYFMGGHKNGQPRDLFVLDLANPAAPTVEGTVPAGSYPVAILVKDETLYTVGDGFLKRFSISDPHNPVLVDTTPSSSLISLSVSSTRAFGAHARNGFFVVDVCSAPLDTPPTANAGVDFSVNEGQLAVALDGNGSSDPDNDPLTFAWVQVGGTTAALTGETTVSPTFTAPVVALGGETLSFDLTVTANGETSTDNVNVTVVNVNHPPVADAGADQSEANNTAVAEGSPVTLHGEDSFDIDSDTFSYAWVQVGGSPTVTITGEDTANPSFTAPTVSAGGAPGVVATLVFQLTVDDGFAPAATDAPAPGYELWNVEDTVTVEITNTNNLPVAAAGVDQTVDENSAVELNGSTSSDPDSDVLTYSWTQVGGPAVTLSGATTATPGFTAPFVSAGGADFEFKLTVDDGYDGSNTDNVVIHVQNANDPPLASAAEPTIDLLWPPNHGLVAVGITGVSDPDNNATIVITSVTQDESTNGLGDGDTPIDAVIDGDAVLLRAERSGKGNGRVYHIHFTASDLEGSSSGVVTVAVPHSKKKAAVDGGELFDSTD